MGRKTSVTPSQALAEAASIWDPAERMAIREPRFKKADLDARRSVESTVPGTRLRATAQDDRLPILVTQQSFGSGSSSSSSLTLVVPAGWGMAFWTSLVWAHSRAGGLAQRSQHAFESGRARFPEDYAFTRAFDEHEARRRLEDEAYWLRRPPAKRPSYRKLGSVDPWSASLASIASAWISTTSVTTTTTTTMTTPMTMTSEGWLASTSLPFAIVSVLRSDPRHAAPEGMSSSWLSNAYDHAKRIVDGRKSGDPALLGGFVSVRVKPLARGSPEELGYVYYLPADRLAAVQSRRRRRRANRNKRHHQQQQEEGDDDDDAMMGGDPKELKLMGRITTGSYSLTHGKGEATASVSIVAWLEMVERSVRDGDRELLCVVRNRDSPERRLARLEMIPMIQQ